MPETGVSAPAVKDDAIDADCLSSAEQKPATTTGSEAVVPSLSDPISAPNVPSEVEQALFGKGSFSKVGDIAEVRAPFSPLDRTLRACPALRTLCRGIYSIHSILIFFPLQFLDLDNSWLDAGMLDMGFGDFLQDDGEPLGPLSSPVSRCSSELPRYLLSSYLPYLHFCCCSIFLGHFRAFCLPFASWVHPHTASSETCACCTLPCSWSCAHVCGQQRGR